MSLFRLMRLLHANIQQHNKVNSGLVGDDEKSGDERGCRSSAGGIPELDNTTCQLLLLLWQVLALSW